MVFLTLNLIVFNKESEKCASAYKVPTPPIHIFGTNEEQEENRQKFKCFSLKKLCLNKRMPPTQIAKWNNK